MPRGLAQLTARYNTTVVLCTATQPSIRCTADFPIGLENVREIISKPAELYRSLRRVRVIDRGPMADATLGAELAARDRVLAIVNTRRHAQEVFRLLPQGVENFHLSALMCPAHREHVLASVRQRLEADLGPAHLHAVDRSGRGHRFPARLSGARRNRLIAQAAGRCNRNGRWPGSELHLFRSEHQRAEAYFRETAQIASQVLRLHEDALGLASVEQFFNLYYAQHNPPEGMRWDSKGICTDKSTEETGNCLSFSSIEPWRKSFV